MARYRDDRDDYDEDDDDDIRESRRRRASSRYDDDDDDFRESRRRRVSSRDEGAGVGFGIAGLVVGIVSLVLSLVPCLGMYAFFPGLIAVILSGLGLAKAKAKGMAVAGLVCSVISMCIACYWYFVVEAAKEAAKQIHDDANKHLGDFNKNWERINQQNEQDRIDRENKGEKRQIESGK